MPSLSKMSLRDLLRRRESLEQELEAAQPALWQELKLVSRLIEDFDTSGEKPYASIKWPKNAIPLCLERNRAWMTREQIQSDLERGGFVFDPDTFPNLLADALRYHASRGTLLRRDESGKLIRPGFHKSGTRFRNEQYGLPEWAKDTKIGSLK